MEDEAVGVAIWEKSRQAGGYPKSDKGSRYHMTFETLHATWGDQSSTNTRDCCQRSPASRGCGRDWARIWNTIGCGTMTRGSAFLPFVPPPTLGDTDPWEGSGIGAQQKKLSLSPVRDISVGKRRSGLSLRLNAQWTTKFTVRLESAACLDKSSPQPSITIPFAAKSTYGTVIHKSGVSLVFSPTLRPNATPPVRSFTSALGPSPSRNSRPRDAVLPTVTTPDGLQPVHA